MTGRGHQPGKSGKGRLALSRLVLTHHALRHPCPPSKLRLRQTSPRPRVSKHHTSVHPISLSRSADECLGADLVHVVRRSASRCPLAEPFARIDRQTLMYRSATTVRPVYLRLAGVLATLVCCTVGCTSKGGAPSAVPTASTLADSPAVTAPADGDATTITGYRVVSLAGASGPVTVPLTPGVSRRVIGLVSALPSGAGAVCEDGSDLVYRVIVGQAAGVARGTVISGYRCGAAVSVTHPGSKPAWYIDTDCRLDIAVRGLVPSRASGTRRASIGCDQPESP
jgi:hypothetical protein